MAERLLLISQPVVFVAAVILARFVEQPSAPGALVRPLLVAIGVAVVAVLVGRALIRNDDWAPLLTSLLLLFLLRESTIAAVIAAFALWWVLIGLIRRRSGRKPPAGEVPAFAARAGSYFALAYMAVMAISAFQATQVRPPELHLPAYRAAGEGGPNIYLIMLDGYPRTDSLREHFGYDNAPFERALGALGFDISTEARANYNKTWLTLASMLNGAYIEDVLGDQPIPPDDASHLRWLYAVINEAALMNAARDRGYVTAAIPVPITTTSLTSADEYIDHGYLTELEARILWSSPVSQLFPNQVGSLLFASQQALIEDSLTTTAELAEHGDGPRVVLTAVHSPHPPFALVPDNAAPPSMPPCFPTECSFWQATIQELAISRDEYRERIIAQLRVLNGLVLDAVQRIVDADPSAVVVLWSDHGLRYTLADTDEHFRSFLAARTPGAEQLYPPDESPVNLLRRIFAHYFAADIEPLPYRAWESNWDYTLMLSRVE